MNRADSMKKFGFFLPTHTLISLLFVVEQ